MERGLCGRSIIHAITGLLDKVSESKTARPPSETYQRKVYRKVLKKLIRFSSRSSCHDRYNNYVRHDGASAIQYQTTLSETFNISSGVNRSTYCHLSIAATVKYDL